MGEQMKRLIASFLAGYMVLLGPVQAAGLITTEQVAVAQAKHDATADRTMVLETLQRADVQARMQSMGLDPALAQARVAALSDEEVSGLAQQIAAAPAGGDVSWLGVALIVLLVLIVTDLLGYTHIFPFIDHANGPR
jgi:hypothetical protein